MIKNSNFDNNKTLESRDNKSYYKFLRNILYSLEFEKLKKKGSRKKLNQIFVVKILAKKYLRNREHLKNRRKSNWKFYKAVHIILN